MYNLGVMHLKGQGVNGDDAGELAAIRFWEEGVLEGDTNSMVGMSGIYLRGTVLSNGTVVHRDHARAMHVLELAADSGSVEAMELLGMGYLHGWWEGGANRSLALLFYGKCAARGKVACVAELGKAVALPSGWTSAMGQHLDAGDEIGDDVRVELGAAAAAGLSLSRKTVKVVVIEGLQIPLEHDCHTGRRLLQFVAQTGTWVHSEIDRALEAYSIEEYEEATFSRHRPSEEIRRLRVL